jgi:hypothetical protein
MDPDNVSHGAGAASGPAALQYEAPDVPDLDVNARDQDHWNQSQDNMASDFNDDLMENDSRPASGKKRDLAQEKEEAKRKAVAPNLKRCPKVRLVHKATKGSGRNGDPSCFRKRGDDDALSLCSDCCDIEKFNEELLSLWRTSRLNAAAARKAEEEKLREKKERDAKEREAFKHELAETRKQRKEKERKEAEAEKEERLKLKEDERTESIRQKELEKKQKRLKGQKDREEKKKQKEDEKDKERERAKSAFGGSLFFSPLNVFKSKKVDQTVLSSKEELQKRMSDMVKTLQTVKTTAQSKTDSREKVTEFDASIFSRVEEANLLENDTTLAKLSPQEKMIMFIMIEQNTTEFNSKEKGVERSRLGRAGLGLGGSSLTPAMIEAWPTQDIHALMKIGKRLNSQVSVAYLV